MNFKLLHATGMLLLGFTLTQTLALAQSATLVKDINSGTAAVASSNPWFHSTGAFTYFSATNPTLGTELYKTLGSTGGATLIKDIHPGPGNAFPGSLHTVGSTTYFAASDGKNGRELWKTDGSSAGTVMVKDIVPGAGSSNPAGIVSIGTTIYFILGIPGGKNDIELAVPQPGELWKSDGTAAGTVLVKKFIISTGNVSISPVDGASALLFVMGNTLYLAADDGNGGVGNELWKSDGTTAGTVLVKDIFPGKDTRGNPNSSSIQYFTAYKGKVYFYARNATSDYELWVTDGTSAGTVRVKDIRTGASGSYPRYLTVFGNYFYFSANDGSGYELWQSDGSTAGTVLLKDINQSTGTASSSPYNNDPNTNPATWKFAIMGNAFYFRANDGTNGTELWKSDGTATGTVMVKDINPGTGSGYPQDIVFDGRKTLYFSANSGNGYELWKCDGTTNGTVLVKDINTTTTTASSSPNYLVGVLLGGVVFRANDGVTGYEPWFSDGTANGTKLVADINKAGPGDTGHGYPRYFADVNGTLFFSANDGKTGYELWKSDGTAAGTVMVKDIRPGTNSSSPYYLTAMDGMVYFRANDGGTGNELWKSDGTAAGTVMVKDIRPGTGASSPAYLTFAGHKTLYFTANNGSNGSELWKTDGTPAGTVMVKDIRAGSGGSSPNYFAMLNGTLYFRANDGIGGTNYELWKSDGTTAGTVMVKDIRPGGSSSPTYLASTGQLIYFRASDATNGTELWKSDGTAAGTVMVKNIAAGSVSSSPNYITPLGNKVFFSATDGTGTNAAGYELWVSDGTSAGTVMVKDIWPGATGTNPNSSSPYNSYGGTTQFRQFAVLGNEVYFRANDGVGGTNQELWKSDGTTAGTVMVKEINPSGSANPSYITPVGSRYLYFQASDSNNGEGMGSGAELWRTDGTTAGTTRLTEINPADNGSFPVYMTLSGGKLFFYALDARKGYELWMVDPGATSQAIGHGCPQPNAPTLAATDPVLGGSITVAARGKPGAGLALLVGLRNNPLGTGIGFGCHFYVDPSKSPTLLFFTPAANGSWQYTTGIPNNASAKGFEVMVQVGYGPTNTGPIGVDLSPGMKLTLGY